MKTVFTNAMCAHVWAQQNQPEGRANSMHFSGPVLFYYATPVAMCHTTKAGPLYLITSQYYTPSTSSKCMPAVRRALLNKQTFSVPWVGYTGARGMDNSQPEHKANLAYLVRCYEQIAERAAHASRKWSGLAQLLPALEKAAEEACAYARAFGLRVPRLDPGKLNNDVVTKRELFDTPEAKAKRAKAAARKKAAAEKKRLLDLRAREQRQYDWRHNVPVHLHPDDRFVDGGSAMLRIHGETVQTSLGAGVSLADARRALKFIRAVHIPGRSVGHFMAQDCAVGPFKIDCVHADGSVSAGCHKISTAELRRFEDLLEVLPR